MAPRVTVVALSILITAGSHLWTATNPEHEAWRSGREALGRKDWPYAASMFALYRSDYPEDVSGWVMEGWTRRQMKQYAEADRLFGQALEIDPGQPDALYHFAYRAWAERNLELAFETLSRIRTVPSNLEQDVNNLAGVLMVLLDREREEAVDRLRRVKSPDSSTRVLLVLALLRVNREPEAIFESGKVCPMEGNDSAARSWIRCLDKDYCGELLAQRLEILRWFVGTAGSDAALVADAVRVHLRHHQDARNLTGLLGAASRAEPEKCLLALLHGLSMELGEAGTSSDSCSAYRRAVSCIEAGGDFAEPRLTGPLYDPPTGALLDPGRGGRLTEDLLALRCGQDPN